MPKWLKKIGSPSKSAAAPKEESTAVSSEAGDTEDMKESPVTPSDSTVLVDNTTGMSVPSGKKKKARYTGNLEDRLAAFENDYGRLKDQLVEEREAKRKLYSSLVKLASQLKRMQRDQDPLMRAADYANQTWYEGGMWRAPQILPGVAKAKSNTTANQPILQPISLSELFFDLIIVMAFTRVGTSVSTNLTVDGPVLAYFAIFWTIWTKEASYSTRFDTTDLSAQVSTLLTCFAVLFGSLSTLQDFYSEDATRMMAVAGFVAVLHLFLHVRVARWYLNSAKGSVEYHVRSYAVYNIIMNLLEAVTWAIGIFVMPRESQYRWIIFLVGIILSLRVPRAFLANDFHGACSKRAVLYILLLGFLLQSIVLEASPFFEYDSPSLEQYAFLGSSCVLLFCIKLLYVEDSNTLNFDHALLINRWAGFFFNLGQFSLLLATTILGSGLDLLTHSYLAATAALPNNAKNLTCGGFSAAVLSIAFIKSMHLRRVPRDNKQRRMFLTAYFVQTFVLLTIVFTTARMCLTDKESGVLSLLMVNEIEMLFVLSGFAFCLVVAQWLDEAVELSLYDTGEDSRQYLVHPFGFWWCLKPEIPLEQADQAAEGMRNTISSERRLSQFSPLLGSSVADLRISQMDLNYDATADDLESG